MEEMTSVNATYEPQDGDTYRCSANFPDWDAPSGGRLMFKVQVDEGFPTPTFSIVHDKVGQDKTWYTGVCDGITIDVDSQEGEGGSKNMYVATTSELNPQFKGNRSYKVIVYKIYQ